MPRDALIAELKRLSVRELESTLAGLDPGEREQIRSIVRTPEAGEPSRSTFEMFAGLSPWLLKAMERAKSAPDGRNPLTSATRAVLSEAFEQLASIQAPKSTAKHGRAPPLGRILGRHKVDEKTS